ncbi:ABC transporter family substrate-binding protein [Streptomyces zagrosensis]|uniref:Peptide/nickel transport system substrate-binding protein n=1 Tax=Streptomyces zagrosensis TaxID=1042984 RepID=A0A7W9V0E0_9ACTN|nr:ABC transporter family substrate-binding protein [Streptomyces zagrosensis]MBB5937712.1 peptide/nickel transport system substrate-binding protein [Streptomyces zagrosensis]
MFRTSRRVATRSTAALCAAVLLGSCSADSGQDGNGPGGKPAARGEQDINAQPLAALRDGGDLRVPVDALPTNYNPVQVNGARVVTWQLTEAILPTAFKDAPTGERVVNKAFFTSAALTSTSPQTIAYRIADDAVWSDGRPITWEDLRGQWRALSGKDTAYEAYSTVGYSEITSVERGRSDKEAVVKLRRPFAEWQGLFSPLVPKQLTATASAFNKGWLQRPAVTAGPFAIDRIDRTGKTITLRRNPSWWAGKPPLNRVILRVLDPAARADELANRGIDLYPIGADLDLFTRARTMPGVEIRTAPERLAGQLTFNGGKGATLADERLRRAVAQTVDREAITAALVGRIVPGAKPVGNHILPPGDPGYRDNSGTLPFDSEAAGKQLDAQGWKLNGKYRVKDGQRLSLRLIGQETPVGKTVCGLLREQLRKAGIEALVRTVPLERFYDGYLLPGNFDLIAFEWTKSASPFAHDRPVFQKPRGNDFGSNFGRIHIPRVDQLYDQGLAELEPAKRRHVANEIDVLAWKHAHHLPLYAGSGAYAVRKELANYGAHGLGVYGFDRAGFTK